MKYYKIVNPKGHHGLIYHDGLNTDPLEFNPSGDCEPGGIYFSREEILAFLEYGTELYEVEPVGEVYEDQNIFNEDQKWKSHQVILKYVGPLEDNIQFLVEQGADIRVWYDEALRWAAYNGHTDVVKYLVDNGADIHVMNESALRWAARNGHIDIVKYLVEHGADIHVKKDWPLCIAACNGHTEIVKYLVDNGADIHARGDEALRVATQHDYIDVVEYLKSLQ